MERADGDHHRGACQLEAPSLVSMAMQTIIAAPKLVPLRFTSSTTLTAEIVRSLAPMSMMLREPAGVHVRDDAPSSLLFDIETLSVTRSDLASQYSKESLNTEIQEEAINASMASKPVVSSSVEETPHGKMLS